MSDIIDIAARVIAGLFAVCGLIACALYFISQTPKIYRFVLSEVKRIFHNDKS